jgi:hypothetical protein
MGHACEFPAITAAGAVTRKSRYVNCPRWDLFCLRQLDEHDETTHMTNLKLTAEILRFERRLSDPGSCQDSTSRASRSNGLIRLSTTASYRLTQDHRAYSLTA